MKEYLKQLLETFREEYDNERPGLDAEYEKRMDEFYERIDRARSKPVDMNEVNKRMREDLIRGIEEMEKRRQPMRDLGMSETEIYNLENQIKDLPFTTPDQPGCLSWEDIKHFVQFFPFREDARYYAHLEKCKDCRLKVYKGIHNPPWGKPLGF